MLTYEQQKKAFLKLISILNKYSVDENMRKNVPQWDSVMGVSGFPSKLTVCIEYTDIKNSNIDLIFYLDDYGEWSKVEIMNIDIHKAYQRKGLGRKFVEQTIAIAKLIGAKKIYGDVLEREDYSSADFYEKCGFEIVGGDFHKIFRMDINENF